MVGKKQAALFAAIALLSSRTFAAEETQPGDAAFVVVSGLAVDDMLNVRATASATGMVIGRLENGSKLRNSGCNEVHGYNWCKITAVDDPGLHGWAPARYLQADPANAKREGETEQESVLATAGIPSPNTSREERGAPVTAPAPDETAQAPTAKVLAAEAPSALPSQKEGVSPVETPQREAAALEALETRSISVELPSNLGARLGGSPNGALGSEAKQAVVQDDAIAAAFQQAFAAEDAPTGSDIYSPELGGETRAAPEAGTASASAPSSAPDTSVAPPSDPVVGSAGARTQVDAATRQLPGPRLVQLQAPKTFPLDSMGEVPCARYIGQPMMRCEAAVARTGADDAEVTVTLPDGGQRVIRFRNGKPESSNSRGEFRFTREGDLSMIRIGTSERFEIPDALAFGD